MAGQDPSTGPRAKWAYGYEIAPPLPRNRLREIKSVLDREGLSARSERRTWEGRFVWEEHAAHILIVSDSPHQELDANRRIEAALRELGVEYSVTAPVELDDPLDRSG